MESSSDPPKKPGADDDDDDHSNRKPPADADSSSMSDMDRSNALKSHRIRYEDAVDPNAERVTEVHPLDVILGRGKRLQDLEGNVRMRRIAQKHNTDYHALKPSEKRNLIETVYREVIEDGARFLIKGRSDDEEADYFYLVVDEEIAKEKLSNILRRKKQPTVDQQPLVLGRYGGGTSLNPAMQQAMSAGRSYTGYNIPGVPSLNPQMMSLGNEVARLPSNPLLSSLDPLGSLPYSSMYHFPDLSTTSERMRLAMMANIMERDRMVRDALTIQQLNAIQESRAAALYSQALQRSALYPSIAGAAAGLAIPQPPPNNQDEEEDEDPDEQ